jgi:hypothetical protein
MGAVVVAVIIFVVEVVIYEAILQFPYQKNSRRNVPAFR